MNHLAPKNIYYKYLGLVLSFFVLSCAIPPPKNAPPKLATLSTRDFAQQGQAPWPTEKWWQQFADTQLEALIEQALANSPNMQIAQARIQQAHAITTSVAADSGANLAASGQVSRQLFSQNFIYPPPLGGTYVTSGNLDLSFSYDFDFWGRHRNILEATLGQRAAAQAEAAGAAATLAAAVAKVYFQWQALNAQITLTQVIADQRTTLVRLEKKRIQAGIARGDTLHALTAAAAVAQQMLVQLNTQRQQILYQLQFLLGKDHHLPILQARALPNINSEIPKDLSIHLLVRRADIAAARDRVQASLKYIDAARAAFYPDINISAFLGLSSLQMAQLLKASSREQGITPAIYLPIFDAGRLHANLSSKEADMTLAIAQYDQAVHTAIAEVNDAIVHLNGIENERASLEKQQQAYLLDFHSSQQRARAGLTDQRETILNQLNVLNAQEQELRRHAQGLLAQIDLIKALGGGYRPVDIDSSTVSMDKQKLNGMQQSIDTTVK